MVLARIFSSVLVVSTLFASLSPHVAAETNANPFPLVRDGAAGELHGYPGLTYQAIRFEPLCGSLGSSLRFSEAIEISTRCTPAMDAFGNNSADLMALYDITGVRLEGAIVGGGDEVCMCFALVGDASNGATCLWVDGSGRADAWWQLRFERILAGSFRPNIDKALPQCKDVDLPALKAEWSQTAVQVSVTEVVRTVGDRETPLPTNQESTVVETITTTATDGSPTTIISTYVTNGPAAPATGTSSQKLTNGELIGLIVGITTIMLMILGFFLRCARKKKAVN